MTGNEDIEDAVFHEIEETVSDDGVNGVNEIKAVVVQAETKAPAMREWDVYEYGEDGVEIIQSRDTWEKDRVGTMIIEDGHSRFAEALPFEFIGRKLVGVTPFGAGYSESITILTRYTQHTRETFNTDNVPGLGGNNIFLFGGMGYDLRNLRQTMPLILNIKRIYSPVIESLIEEYSDDRELVLSTEMWNRFELLFEGRQPKKARRRA